MVGTTDAAVSFGKVATPAPVSAAHHHSKEAPSWTATEALSGRARYLPQEAVTSSCPVPQCQLSDPRMQLELHPGISQGR